MQTFDDLLRSGLRDLADQAEPAGFGAEPLIRKAARRRARFTAAAGCCAVALIAAAVTVPAVAARPAPPAVVSLSPSPAPGAGPWPAPFSCGRPLSSALPGSSGFGLKVSVQSVLPPSVAPAGAPAVTWTLAPRPGSAWPVFGALRAVVLVVNDDGTVVAALQAPPPADAAQIPAPSMDVTASQVRQGRPRVSQCPSPDWTAVWNHRALYRVVVLVSAWAGFPASRPATLPARYSVMAPLPLGSAHWIRHGAGQ